MRSDKLIWVSIVSVFCINLFFNSLYANSLKSYKQNVFDSIKLWNPLNIINYKFEDGLVSNNVYEIDQDSSGYIWIATKAGLSRFNGDEFYNFTTKNGLKKNETFGLYKTETNRIWMANYGPLGYIENSNFNYIVIDINQDLHWNFSILEKNDSILLTTADKFYLINKELNICKSFYNDKFCKNAPCKLLGSYKNKIILYKNDKIYYFKNENLVDSIALEPEVGLQFRIAAVKYKTGIFYINKNKLRYFDFENKQTKKFNVQTEGVSKIEVFGNKMFFTYLSGGLKSLNIKENLEIREEHKHHSDIIFTDIFKDKDQNYWLGTNSRGIFFIPKESDQIISKSSIDNINLNGLNCLYVDGDTILLGTNKAELILLYNNQITLKALPFENPNGVSRIIDIEKIEEGKFLISSDAGLFVYERGNLKHVFYAAIKKMSLFANDIYLDSHLGLFLLKKDSLNSLIKFLEKSNIKSLSKLDRNNAYIKNIANITKERSYQTLVVNKNEIYVNEPLSGLSKYLKDGDKLIHKDLILDNTDITDLLYYKNQIYIATSGDGILKYNIKTNKIEPLSGVNSSIISSLSIDKNILYAGSNNGLHIITLNDVGLENNVVTVNKNQGLLSTEITQVLVADTCVIAISDRGLNFIQKNYKANYTLPNFKIEQFKVNEEIQPLKNNYKLASTENNISVTFNKIDFNKNITTQFAYKIDDEDWVYTKNNSINFNSLEPEGHELKFGLVFELNKVPQKVKEIKFYIKPKFSQTIWAKLIAVLVALIATAIIILYFFANRYVKILEKRVKQRTEQLSQKVQELDVANNNLQIKNKNLNSYTYLVSHDLKAPLYNISSFLKIISQKNKKKFDKQDNEYFNNIEYSLSRMINKINDLLKYSKIRSDIDLKTIEPICLHTVIKEIKEDFKFEIEKKGIQLIVEPEMPNIKLGKTSAHLLFQNLISNSIKYNRPKSPFVKIDAILGKNTITFFVEDNGIGIRKSYQTEVFDIFSRGRNSKQYEGTGVGLAICKKIVEAHGGKIKLKSEENKGTVFTLIFPIVS